MDGSAAMKTGEGLGGKLRGVDKSRVVKTFAPKAEAGVEAEGHKVTGFQRKRAVASALHRACESGQLVVACNIIERDPSKLNACDKRQV